MIILRVLMGAAVLLTLTILEQGIFSPLPLVFLSGVLILHYVRPVIGWFWLASGGILLDLFGLPAWPETVAFALAGALGIFLARRVFTNRSLYAMMGLGVSMYAVVAVTWILTAVVRSLQDRAPLDLEDTLVFIGWQALAFLLGLLVTFLMSRRLAKSLRTLFFVRQLPERAPYV